METDVSETAPVTPPIIPGYSAAQIEFYAGPKEPKMDIEPTRIGLILADRTLNVTSIKFLLISMNKAQRHFQFELLPFPPSSPLIENLQSQGMVDRNATIRPLLAEFRRCFIDWIHSEMLAGRLSQELPDMLVLVSLAKFSDYFYTMREPGISVLALGNWERWMAPPSLAEFIQTLVVREVVADICPALHGSVHLGTRGCICDFTGPLRASITCVVMLNSLFRPQSAVSAAIRKRKGNRMTTHDTYLAVFLGSKTSQA